MTPDLLVTREFYLMLRQALLMQVDAIERLLCIVPRTAELRQMNKQTNEQENHGEI